MRRYSLLAFDLLVFAVSPILALWLRDNFILSWEKLVALMPYAIWGVALATVFFVVFGTHRSVWRYVSLHDIGRLVIAISLSIGAAMFIMFALNRLEGVARSIPLIQWFFCHCNFE